MLYTYLRRAITVVLLVASLYILYQLLILGQSLDTNGKLIILVTSLWNLSRWYYDKYIKSS